jgi:EmrB/QacA subfamily drug resistance transporter
VINAKPSSKWWVMAAVAIGVFLSTIDGSIVNVALPTLAHELHAPFAAVQWVVLAYLLTLVTLMMVAGRLADLRGKKPLYAGGFVIFTLGSVCCGLSSSVEWLLAARVLQAVGASLLMALGAAIATEAFPREERGRAMGLIGLMVSIGLVTGPTLGGLILGVLPWQAIFFVNLPLGVFGIVLVLWVVPAHPPPPHQPFDLLGTVLLFVTLLSFLLAVTLGPKAPPGAPHIVALGLLAIAGGVLFVRTERAVEHPLIDLGIFATSTLSVNVVTGSLVFVASSGLVFLVPFYLQDLQGRTPAEAGLLLVVSPLVMGLTAPVSGWLSDRVGTRPLTVVGMVTLLVGYFLIGGLRQDTPAWEYIARVFWVGLGMGIFNSPNNSAIMGAVPRERLGVASGLLSLTRTLGQTTGIALVGATWAALTLLFDQNEVADARAAPVDLQLEAFRWTAMGLCVLVSGGVALAVLTWRREARGQR